MPMSKLILMVCMSILLISCSCDGNNLTVELDEGPRVKAWDKSSLYTLGDTVCVYIDKNNSGELLYKVSYSVYAEGDHYDPICEETFTYFMGRVIDD